MSETADHLRQVDALHAKIARALSEHRQSFGHNDEQFWSFCSCNENEPHVMEDGPDMPDPVKKRAFWATGVEIFAEHLAARAIDEVEEAGWASPEEAKAREAAARREALLEAADVWIEGEWHPVFFNRDADDLSPQGRVAKWLRDRAALANPEPQHDQGNQDRAAAHFRAALADDVTQRPDVAHEEDGRCTELTCPQHGPANRAKKEER